MFVRYFIFGMNSVKYRKNPVASIHTRGEQQADLLDQAHFKKCTVDSTSAQATIRESHRDSYGNSVEAEITLPRTATRSILTATSPR